MRIAGSTFLVTGASRGIGRALAQHLAGLGAHLHLTARSDQELSAVAQACQRRGVRVAHTPGDVGAADDAARVVGDALAAHGHLDVLVNNAALLTPPAPVAQSRIVDWEDVLRVNVLGCVHMIRAVLPSMLRRRAGAIVNLSSGWGRVGEAGVAPYCASKFAVEGLTQSLAAEVGPDGLTALALNPGIVNTEMLRAAWPDAAQQYPSPESLAVAWTRLFERLGPELNGRSLDLDDFRRK